MWKEIGEIEWTKSKEGSRFMRRRVGLVRLLA